jgi:hypothetical protein
MTNTQHRETAKIYQFPAGGRDALRGRRTVIAPIDEATRLHAQRPVVGGSWYHEEAIREAEPVGQR